MHFTDGEQCGKPYGVEEREDMEFAAEYQGIPDELQDIVPDEYRIEAEQFLTANNLVITPRTAQAVYLALCNRQ